MGLPDSYQPRTIVIVRVMMAIRWLENHVKENNRHETPTKEQLQELDCLKDLDLFETTCKILQKYQLDIGAGVFKQAFVTQRNAATTKVKRTSRTSECDGREREEMLKEDLERNLTLCLHNSFCRNMETNVDPLPCCKQRVEGQQKCWRTAQQRQNSYRRVARH